jgi:hypothetical protein
MEGEGPSVAPVDRGNDHRVPVDDHPEVTGETRVQDRVEFGTVQASLIPQTTVTGAIGVRQRRREGAVVHVDPFTQYTEYY